MPRTRWQVTLTNEHAGAVAYGESDTRRKAYIKALSGLLPLARFQGVSPSDFGWLIRGFECVCKCFDSQHKTHSPRRTRWTWTNGRDSSRGPLKVSMKRIAR